MAAEPKHYVGYGNPVGGLNCAPCTMGRHDVFSDCLPVFEAAFADGKACDAMCSYNSIDSIPVSMDHDQGIFQNPMVSPSVLGASAGAAFGAALGLFFSMNYGEITVLAFLFGIGAVLLVCLIGSRVRQNQTLGLVLAGMMVGSLFSSAVSFLKLVADTNNTLPAITYWLMGSLSGTRMRDLVFAAPLLIVGMAVVYLMRWKINVLTLGEEEAKCIGVDTKRVRWIVVGAATLITAAAVSVSGLIGWVGLVIPHLARMLVGNDYRKMVPASLLLGASYMMVVDNVSRLLLAKEIPIGILTAFIGAPFFLYLILKEGNSL